ncbi:hypothetical protein A6R68_09666, partial [Neotoma lepida]
LRNLIYLSINHNQLTVIPTELCSLVNLSELHLNYNQIMCIPEEIKLLKNLQQLLLARNNIEEIAISYVVGSSPSFDLEAQPLVRL